MKIAVLGARGFVGSSLAAYFKHNHTVVPVTRQTIDLLDPVKVRKWLENEKFDIVVNAATYEGNASAYATEASKAASAVANFTTNQLMMMGV